MSPTFALLYSTQALLPLISADLGATASAASWTVSAATGALALFVLPLSALSERFGRTRMMTVSLAIAVAVGLLVPFAPNVAGWWRCARCRARRSRGFPRRRWRTWRRK
ncbi:hypothetical protein Sviol_24770 [Streptomyces violascens]|uniref:Major facilitator superfamily (MFS) profile domain-containing protein n=1 Tax=Streptomyces violascens TaxID=67381 RepID=A0ABQ3QLE3_9ACTN|nr:hypothetical protein Sviol_24770 [Streptomyces violascens]